MITINCQNSTCVYIVYCSKNPRGSVSNQQTEFSVFLMIDSTNQCEQYGNSFCCLLSGYIIPIGSFNLRIFPVLLAGFFLLSAIGIAIKVVHDYQKLQNYSINKRILSSNSDYNTFNPTKKKKGSTN